MASIGRPHVMRLTAKNIFSSEILPDIAEECAFFSKLKMRNGTFKYTQPDRFAEVEHWLAPLISKRLSAQCSVLDLGASTGLTTIELADFLRAQSVPPACVVATDLFVEAHLVELVPGLWILCDAGGYPLHYDVGYIGVRAWVRRLDYLTLAALPLHLARICLKKHLSQRIASRQSQPVRMQSRALRGQGIDFVESDLFIAEPRFYRRFDFIRAANILNLGYFDDRMLAVAVRHLHRYARAPGSLLFVLKTTARRHDGTLFELGEDGAFRIVSRVGQGTEIEDLILEVGRSGP